jgi:hypothetical protein
LLYGNNQNDQHGLLYSCRQLLYNYSSLTNKIGNKIGLASLAVWSNEKRSAVWIYLPIELAKFAAVSAKYGFKYHHAEEDEAVLCKWLPENKESKIPMFATHQVGVAGIVFRPDTNQLLMIQDKNMAKHLWKFPGGAGKNPSVFEAQSDIYTEKL